MTSNFSAIRRQFPIFRTAEDWPRRSPERSRALIYLDNAATAQKPKAVIDAIKTFYETTNANVHRGMHILAEQATTAYEESRTTVQKFINAKHAGEIVFTKNCTESINIVANGFIGPENHVALSILEHHSNIVPWMQQNAHVHWIDIDESGSLKLEELDRILAKNMVKLVSVTGQSNVLGVRPPLKAIIERAHAAGAKVLVDAAQLVAHHQINVQDLDCDFLAFSGHKLYGPTGIGVLYGKRELLESIPPLLGGGMMIREVTRTGFTPADIPHKFEGGTPPIAEVVGLKAAIDWLSQFDWKDIEEHERSLLNRTEEVLRIIPGLLILPSHPTIQLSSSRSGCLSFTLSGIHPHDLTDILGRQGICLRAGHHCTMPLHKKLGIPASTRVSIAIYNTIEEVNMLPAAIEEARKKILCTA